MNNLRALGRPVSFALLLALVTASVPAFGQTDEQRSGARALATEGATAFNEGRYKDAADLFGRAESLVHAPPHLLFLARSYAKLGQFVRARETYIKITKEQVAPNAPQAFRDAQSAAQDELKSVEPKIAKLTIQIANAQDAQNLSVTIDGNPVPAVLIGVPQPVDPGEHRVEATAAGKRARAQTVSLRDGERGAVNLQLEADSAAVGAPAAVAPGAVPGSPEGTPNVPGPATTPVPPPAPEPSSGSGTNGMRIGSYVGFGVGALGIGLGTLFLLKGSSKRSEADDAYKAWYDECYNKGCPASRAKVPQDLDDQATKAQRVGVAGMVVGGLGVAAGVTLFVMSGKQGSSETRTGRLVPIVSPNYIGVSGAF